jgi:hypothetical protein
MKLVGATETQAVGMMMPAEITYEAMRLFVRGIVGGGEDGKDISALKRELLRVSQSRVGEGS